MHTCTKQYRDFPAAHRQPNHDGHCRLIHGHNWGFDIEFTCEELDACGFVVDVGKLQLVKQLLTDYFDHTLLLNESDPYLGMLRSILDNTGESLATIISLPNCGMEGLAEFVFRKVSLSLSQERGLRVSKVTCWEDSKNSATYSPK